MIFCDKMIFYIFKLVCTRMVLDNTTHMVTSKHHKMDVKTPILRFTLTHKYLEFKNYKPTIPSLLLKYFGPFVDMLIIA